jgi:tetratricopeptide (TPR) repeat protein
VTYHPTPSLTGLKPAIRAQAKYWNLERRTRRAWKPASSEESLSLINEALLTALAREGIWMNMSALSEETLTERIRSGVPVAVFQSPEALYPEGVRALLLTGFRESPREYLLFDPQRGILIQSAEHFRTLHENALKMSLILCPGNQVTWNRTPSESHALAQYHEHRLEWPDAISIWETLLENGAEDSPVLVRIGNAWLQENNSALAEQRFREAIQADETNAAAYNNLAYLLVERNPVEAERLVRQAHALYPDDPGILDTLAFTLMQLERPEEASAWLERSRPRLKERPLEDQLAILTRLAQSYAQSGQDHLVRQVLDQLFRLKSDFRVPVELARYLQPHHPALR